MNRKIDSSFYKSSAKADYTLANRTPAYVKYTKVLKNQPNDSTCLHKIFAILYHQRKYKLAEAKIRKALIISPNSSRAHFNRGVVLDILGKYKESETSYRQCIKFDQKMRYKSSYRNLAAILMKQGREREALEFCQIAIRLLSYDGIAYNVLGYIYFLQGEYDEAVEAYERGIRFTPSECIIYLNKAIVLWLLEKKEEAELTLEMMRKVEEKRSFKQEIEVFTKEIQRLRLNNGDSAVGTNKRACIEGIQFILNILETEVNAPKL